MEIEKGNVPLSYFEKTKVKLFTALLLFYYQYSR
jgi:hypothetical protein